MGPWLLLLFIVGDILGTGIYALTGQVANQVGGVVWLPFLVAFAVALVTAFNTVFDRISDEATWTPREWGFFLEDLRANVLEPDAEILVKLNPNKTLRHDEPTLSRFFGSLGADIALPFVYLRVTRGAFSPTNGEATPLRTTSPAA